MADHTPLSRWVIYILSQRLVAGNIHTVRQRCVSYFFRAICRTNPNWFEFVQVIAATKVCRKDNDFHKINCVTRSELLRRLVPRTYRSDLSPSVSRLVVDARGGGTRDEALRVSAWVPCFITELRDGWRELLFENPIFEFRRVFSWYLKSIRVTVFAKKHDQFNFLFTLGHS